MLERFGIAEILAEFYAIEMLWELLSIYRVIKSKTPRDVQTSVRFISMGL
jgi:hypothetical protein